MKIISKLTKEVFTVYGTEEQEHYLDYKQTAKIRITFFLIYKDDKWQWTSAEYYKPYVRKEIKMEEYLRLLKIFNERHHSEYHGYACVVFFDDGSGYFSYEDKEISYNYTLDFGFHFNNFDEYKNICENG